MHWWDGAIGIPLAVGLGIAAFATGNDLFLFASAVAFLLTIGLDLLIERGEGAFEVAVYLCLGLVAGSFAVILLTLEVDAGRHVTRALSIPLCFFLLFVAACTVRDFGFGVVLAFNHLLGRPLHHTMFAYSRGDVARALDALDVYLETHTDDLASHKLRVLMLTELGRHEQAVDQAVHVAISFNCSTMVRQPSISISGH